MTKRESTLEEWKSLIKKYIKRANDSAECFYRFSEDSDLEHLIEDCETLLKIATRAKAAINFMNENNIK